MRVRCRFKDVVKTKRGPAARKWLCFGGYSYTHGGYPQYYVRNEGCYIFKIQLALFKAFFILHIFFFLMHYFDIAWT